MSGIKYKYSIIVYLLFIAVSSPVYADACNVQDMPKALFNLVKAKKYDEAVKQALGDYDKDRNNKQAAFILARVYINASLRNVISLDVTKLGFKPGETGTKSITSDALKSATHDSYTVNPKYFERADSFVRETVERWPESKSLYYCLAKLHFYSGDHKRFLSVLDKTAKLQKDNEDEAVDFLIGYGVELMQSQRYGMAADVYETLLKTFPDSVPLLSSLGVAYVKQGYTRKAMPFFDKAYHGNKNDMIVVGNIAETSMLLRDFKKAEVFMRKLIQQDPNRVATYFDLAINAMHAGPKKSLPYWKQYFEANKKHPDDEQWAKNARIIRDAVKQNKTNIDQWYNLAIDMIKANVPKYAIALLYYVDQKSPNDASVSYSMAHAYDVGRNYDLQEEVLLETLRRLKMPKGRAKISQDEIRYNLARCTYMLNKYDDALAHLAKISNGMKKRPNIDYMYGLVFQAQGKKQKAKNYFQSCLKKAGTDPIAGYCRNKL